MKHINGNRARKIAVQWLNRLHRHGDDDSTVHSFEGSRIIGRGYLQSSNNGAHPTGCVITVDSYEGDPHVVVVDDGGAVVDDDATYLDLEHVRVRGVPGCVSDSSGEPVHPMYYYRHADGDR